MRSPIVGVGFTKNNCRGGFYPQYPTSTNNLNKPAPTPPITYINLDFLNMRSPIVGADFTKNNCRGGFYPQYPTSTNNLNKPAPPITYINLDFLNMRSPIVGADFTKNNCRGGFYQQYPTSTNNLNKPAPTPPITYILISSDSRNISGRFTLFVRAGLPDCGLLTMIVGETRPYPYK